MPARLEKPCHVFRWGTLYLLAAYLLFAIRYTVPDQFMFFLPFYALVAVFAGVGFARFIGGMGGSPVRLSIVIVTLAIGPILYAGGPGFWRGLDLPTPGRSDLPFRDSARYWLTPWKNNEDSAGRFARAAMAQLRSSPPGGARMVIADSTSYYPLEWVRQQEGLPYEVVPDLREDSDVAIRREEGVFLVSNRPGYYPGWLATKADFRKAPGDVLFRVVWK